MVVLQALLVMPELLNSVHASWIMSLLKWWAQSLFMGAILVDLKPMDAKFPDCFTPKSTELTQSHLANTVELHMTLKTVVVPMVDTSETGDAALVLDVMGGGGGLGEQVVGYV